MLPDTQEHFLRHIVRFRCITQHPSGQTYHARQMAANQLGCRPLVAGANAPNQLIVRIPHGVIANSDLRPAPC